VTTSEPYRAPRVTPEPIIWGPQTAVVVGKSGEEIWTDEYGRVKVQFHWDRYGQSDEESSCWVRVSTSLAGKTWGAIAIPRIGQEVVVEFLEGDPDRPIVTGSVYNKDQMPPYGLPDNQTQIGLKTRSSKNGDAESFNELRFEDRVEEEEVYFHAEKDFNRVVENNDTLKVGYEKLDPGDQTIEIANDQVIKVEHDRTVTITNADTLTVDDGDRTVTASSGSIKMEAMTSIELVCGQSTIKLEPAKITIESAQIQVSGDADVKVNGAMVEADGSATLTLKGGIVQIN
jgi:type VI secretion system secreted protein VgrG